MTLPDVYALYDYWADFPPEHELLAMLSQVYTTWLPETKRKEAHEQARRQTAEMLKGLLHGGGRVVLQAPGAQPSVTMAAPTGPGDMGGIGPFPGYHGPIEVKLNDG